MTIASRRFGLRTAAVFASTLLAAASFTSSALSQTGMSQTLMSQTVPDPTVTEQTPLERQLARVDLGISAAGIFSINTTGTNYLGQSVNERPSNTVGVLATLRYTRSPRVGAELNYVYSRRTELYTLNATPNILGVQTNASEFSAGYLVHTRNQYFGVQPYASGGIGVLSFKPTNGGGQGLPKEPVALYYYSIGVESPIFDSHFGYRAGFRQTFSLAPDFLQNYLLTQKHSTTFEPTIGFFVRF